RHLQGSRTLARPAWPDVDTSIQHVQDHRAADDDDIAADDKHWKPNRELVIPVRNTQRDYSREHQPLVRDRVENDAKLRALIEMPGNVPIDAVTCGGDHKESDGAPPFPLLRLVVPDAAAIVDRHHDKTGN